uniref:DDE_3 domain-containing protein n=1 Tax=Heterorhabditis bacteriophora TaxID=37862 RepID=A0A1I7XKM3_HETBA
MGHASTLSLHEGGQIKALSTTGYTPTAPNSTTSIVGIRIFQYCPITDEVSTNGPDGYHSYSRELRKEHWYFPTRKFGGGSVMVWSAFSAMGLVDLSFVSTKMSSADYRDVLGHRLVPYLQRFPGVSFTWQQDNATIHASRSTKTRLEYNDVATMNWLSCSSDLNPMGNIWAILVCRIYADNRQFEITKGLQCVISKVWSEVDKSVIKILVNSMLERIFQVSLMAKCLCLKNLEIAVGTAQQLFWLHKLVSKRVEISISVI